MKTDVHKVKLHLRIIQSWLATALGVLVINLRRNINVAGVIPGIRPAAPRVGGCTKLNFSFSSVDKLGIHQ